jgi:hypothetical protein
LYLSKRVLDKISKSNEGFGYRKQNYFETYSTGYKIDDENYLSLNFLITVVGFSIYKSYYISEQKTKYNDVFRIFANEYIKRINEIKYFKSVHF